MPYSYGIVFDACLDELRIGLTQICAIIFFRLRKMILFMAHSVISGAVSALLFMVSCFMKAFSLTASFFRVSSILFRSLSLKASNFALLGFFGFSFWYFSSSCS